MLVLFWAALLFSAQGASNDGTGTFLGGRQTCYSDGFCINLNQGAIKAEAGLCAVIPCSVTVPSTFEPKGSIWCKNDLPQTTCPDSNAVFNSKNNINVLSGFKGRVALLEKNSTTNCSIIINDLTESDSGSYIFRVTGIYHSRDDALTFNTPTTITVNALNQKPTLAFRPLTDGQQTTLTCIAPGRCSGSPPEIIWTWRGTGEKASHITSNTTTKNLKSGRQKHSSTLTFTPSAEHHGTEVTCKVSFRGNITTEQTVTLNVTYLKKPEITGTTTVREGDTLNLTCSAESYPPSLVTWTRLYSNGAETELQNGTEQATLVMPNMRVEDSGPYVCTAQHLNTTRTVHANITVMYLVQYCEPDSAVLPWAIAGASISVNVFYTIYLVFLWNARKNVKPKQEDSTYISLDRKDRSPEYDVIARPPN